MILLPRVLLICCLALPGCDGDPSAADGGGDLSSLDKGPGDQEDTGTFHDGPKIDNQQQDPCIELAQDYLSTLALAKACNPTINTPQCLNLIDDQLGCPCQTHINQLNTTEIHKLISLKQQWSSLDCSVEIACTGVECPDPGQGVCQENGSATRCKDVIF